MKYLSLLVSSLLILNPAFAADGEVTTDQKYVEYQLSLAYAMGTNALVGALGRKAGVYCEDGTYISQITGYAVRSIEAQKQYSLGSNQPTTLFFITQDIEEQIGTQFSFRLAKIQATSEETPFNAAVKALVGSEFYGPAPGAYGNTSIIKFNSETEATLQTQELTDVSVKWNSRVVKIEIKSSENEIATVTIDGKSYNLVPEFNTDFTPATYNLVPSDSDNAEDAYYKGFVQTPSECEA